MNTSKSSAQIKQRFIRNAQVLSSVMTPKGDVQVKVQGSKAYTNFKEIVIPNGDFCDEGFVRLVKGLVDHECGHIFDTDEGSMPEAHKRSKITAKFLNIFEDVRMEGCVMKRFPGCEFNLLDTVKEAITRGWFAEPMADAKMVELVQSYILYRGRSEFLGQYPVALFAQVAEEQLAKSFGSEFFSKLSAIVDQVPTMNTSWDALLLANQVIDMLEEEQEEQENQDDQQQADSSSDQQEQSDDSGDTDSESDSSDQSGDDSGDPSDSNDDSSEQSSSGKSGDDDSQQSGVNSGSSDDNDSSNEGDGDSDEGEEEANEGDLTPEEKAQQIAEMLDADDDELMKDFHEQIQEALSNDAEEAQKEGRAAGGGHVQTTGRFSVNGVLDKKEALASGRSIAPSLKRLLLDMNKHEMQYRNRGSNLSNSKLTGVATGNFNVFKHEIISKSPNTAVSLLVDRSSSMEHNQYCGETFMEIANACTYALSHTMENLKGISTEVSYYPFGDSLHVAKSFNEKTAISSSRFEVNGSGGTPTGTAMSTALRSIVLRPEAKKILFVLTDGEANNGFEVSESIRIAKACGVQVVGIGIGTGMLEGFEDTGFVSVRDISELHIAVKEIFQQSLIAA